VANEREAKLQAPDTFRIAALDGVADDLTVEPERRQRMLATYFDTAELTLARAGITLRHRSGESGEPWTLKLAGTTSGSELVRREITFHGSPARVPAAAADLVRAHVRGRPLVPVARLRTVRTIRELRDERGVAVEIADDRVTAYSRFRRIATFREIEVELKTDDESRGDLVDAVVEVLVAHGAVRGEPLSKLARALGPAAQSAPDVVVGEVGKRTDVGEFVRHVVASSTAKLLAHDPPLRLAADVVDVHQFRVATRRLRSDLRTFAPLLDPEWVASLRAELSWIAEIVGAVRDSDVLWIRLHEQSSELGEEDSAGSQSLLRVLTAEGDRARVAMHEALRSTRYDRVVESLVAASSHPQFADAADVDAMARPVAAHLVRRTWKRLRREVRHAGKHPTDEQLHEIRIVAKRSRYAAEAAARVVGTRAETFASAIADVQTVLGDHHDAAVAEHWLRTASAAADEPAAAGITAGLLIARQRRDRTRLAREWRDVWARASRSELRRWF
jgi:CHAD domain-containing protein